MDEIKLKSIKRNIKLAINKIQITINRMVAANEENTYCFTSGFINKQKEIRVNTTSKES